MRKNKNRNLSIGIWVLPMLCLGALPSQAQLLQPMQSQVHYLNNAEQQYSQALYNASVFAAQQHAHESIAFFNNNDPIVQKDRARFIAQVARLKLGVLDTTSTPFTQAYYAQRIALEKAYYYFKKMNWSKAISAFKDAGIANLSNQEIIESKFLLAYCYFNEMQFAEAKSLLVAIKELPGTYHNAAQYYYGLLAYNEGNYNEALKAFEPIATQKEYQEVVPYYIAEIFYFQKQYTAALEKAQTLLNNNTTSYYNNELRLLLAQIYFEHQKDYAKALPYLEHYYQHVSKIRKQDLYKLGFCYYATQQWEKASQVFLQLSPLKDALGQNAMYLLAESYLKLKEQQGAKNAFSLCSQMSFDQDLIAPSLLNAAKLSFELGYPKEGIDNLKNLISNYPNSVHYKEAVQVLSEQLLESGSYFDAYQLLQNNAGSPPGYLQKASYAYAMYLFQKGDRAMALQVMNNALAYPVYPEYTAASHFWKSELEYLNGNYSTALNHAQQFLALSDFKDSRISSAATAQHTLMTLGYCALKLKNYPEAKKYFAQAQSNQAQPSFSSKSASEALLRQADAEFLAKEYASALGLYNKVIALSNTDKDYALFQKSTLLGLLDQEPQQEAILKELSERKNSVSTYRSEAIYTLGDMEIEKGNFEKALNYFKKLTDSSVSPLMAKVQFKTAYCYQELNKTNEAIEAFKKVWNQYPNTEQARAAQDALKSLYISSNQAAAYKELLEAHGQQEPHDQSLDSVFYASAETQYSTQKYADAAKAYSEYLKQYPNGIFEFKAHYYRGASYYQIKKFDEALADFDYILKENWTDFTELAAAQAAEISFAQQQYTNAQKYYERLRLSAVDKNKLLNAYKGLMLCANKLNDATLAKNYADTLIQLDATIIANREQAQIVQAHYYQSNRYFEPAKKLYDSLVKSNNVDFAAESYYQLAYQLYATQKWNEAEKAAQLAIKKSNASTYWNTKSYLLMADIFSAQKDYFNARATLQSVIKYCPIEALKEDAKTKLEQVNLLEKGKSKLIDG